VRRIELLTIDHDRKGFNCGSEPLNAFLNQTARQHSDRGISRTFVLIDEMSEKTIIGFFTLSLCELKSENIPPAEARKLPRDVSGVRLGRLAVAFQFQRQGFGMELLVGAMQKFVGVFQAAGGIGLFVDAKDSHARRYYEQFGFVPLSSNDLQLFLPALTIQRTLTGITNP